MAKKKESYSKKEEIEEALLNRTTEGKRYSSYDEIAHHFDNWAKERGIISRPFYNPFAYSYEEDVKRFKYHAPEELATLVLSLLQDHEDMKTVLDVGCGTGLVGKPFLEKRYIVDGIDISRAMMAHAIKHGYRNLKKHNIATTPLETTVRYDIAVSVGVVGEYVPADCAAENVVHTLQDRAVIGVAGKMTEQGTWDLQKVLKQEGFQEVHFHRGFGYQHSLRTPVEYAYIVFTRGV